MSQTLIRAIDIASGAADTLRAVDYLRVSTEEQKKGYGIVAASKKTTRHMQRKGWEHVDTFADEGYSGSLDHTQRPDLKRLMAAARQTPRPFDVVVVSEERAIGRRDRAFWPWVWALEDLGIFVAVVRGDYDNTTEEGRSKMRKEADRAEDERRTIRDRTQGGVQEKAEFGGHPGGVAPYGYRIENQGKKGESRLVLDAGDGHEAVPVLRRAWTLIVEECKTPGQVEDIFNSEHIPGPTMDHWPRGSLRHILTGRAVQEAVRVFRDPSSGTKTDASGTPIYGETVTIELDPIFTDSELKRLNKALERTARGPRASTAESVVHPLSTHLVGACGAHYTGVSWSSRGDKRAYRCTGKVKKEKCSCTQIDADAVESSVWSEVCKLLEDPDRLNQMAADWVDMAKSSGVDYEARIAELGEQIDELEATISVSITFAARQAARKRLGPKETEASVERAVRPLNEELDKLEKLRDEAVAWQQEADGAINRARDLQSLAEMARKRLHGMDARQKAEVMHLLDVQVTILGDIPRKTRGDDQISTWFRDRDRVVPHLTDEAWALVEPVFSTRRGRKPKDARACLEATLHKARTGCSWRRLEYGNVASVWQRWLKSGLWEALLDALAAVPGAPAYEGVVLPPMRVEGRVDPRLFISGDESPDQDDLFKASSVGGIPFRMTLAA